MVGSGPPGRRAGPLAEAERADQAGPMTTRAYTVTTHLIDPLYETFGPDPLGDGPGRQREWPMPATPPRTGLTSPSSWAELLYCVVGLAPAIVFFTGTVTLLSVGVGLTVIYVGIPVLMLALLFARAGGNLQRILARATLDLPIVGFAPIRPGKPGFLGLVGSVLTDPSNWRSVGYHCINLVMAAVRFSVAIAFYAYGLGAISYPIWRVWLPLQQAPDGSWHRGEQWAPHLFVDNLGTMGVQAVLGVLVLLLAPKVVRLLTTMDRVLIAGLLSGPGR